MIIIMFVIAMLITVFVIIGANVLKYLFDKD